MRSTSFDNTEASASLKKPYRNMWQVQQNDGAPALTLKLSEKTSNNTTNLEHAVFVPKTFQKGDQVASKN